MIQHQRLSPTETTLLTPEQIASYHEKGFLHIPNVFTPQQTAAMRDDLNWMIDAWATKSAGWTGPWRKAYMDEKTEAASKLIAMHDLYLYAQSWMQGVTNPRLTEAMSQMLASEEELATGGAPVELHHSTMHVKDTETGHPFPMHQDNAFYEHTDSRYVDVLVHLDDTCHDNGEIRFVPGSHKLGYLDHITRWEGEPCTPHLPWEQYGLEDTVAVPAKAGDVVCFNVLTIHGSHINQTHDMRRMVRVGYRHPDNRQLSGQSVGRPGFMVQGRRARRDGRPLFSIMGPAAELNEFALAEAEE